MRSFFKNIFSPKEPTVPTNNASQTVFLTVEENISFITKDLFQTEDLKIQNFTVNKRKACIIYLDTMIDTDLFKQDFILPLIEAEKDSPKSVDLLLNSPDFQQTNQLNKVVTMILQGNYALFIEGEAIFYLFNNIQATHRSPDEPQNEKAIRGSHKGFIENVNMNLNFIRERIQNRKLTIKYFHKGEETNIKIAMIYMNGIANSKTVANVQRRIESISADMVFSPGYIEEVIEDSPFSPFQQVLFTERPDRVEANLIEGRVIIISEGSSDVAIVPASFFSFFQSSDDYNNRYLAGSLLRLLRLFSFWGALTLPAIYIAVIGFHFEMIPYKMIGLVKGSIESIPFNPFVEALLMTVTIELIREAGIRLPTPIAQTIGIVGGLIIGDAVVNAGLVSNIMVIIIALTAIMSFTIPSYEMANTVRILSIPVMLGAATLGFVGITFSLMMILIHMCTLESFGTAYFSPLSPFHFKELKDALIRVPNWLMDERPVDIKPEKPISQNNSREWDQDE